MISIYWIEMVLIHRTVSIFIAKFKFIEIECIALATVTETMTMSTATMKMMMIKSARLSNKWKWNHLSLQIHHSNGFRSESTRKKLKTKNDNWHEKKNYPVIVHSNCYAMIFNICCKINSKFAVVWRLVCRFTKLRIFHRKQYMTKRCWNDACLYLYLRVCVSRYSSTARIRKCDKQI